MTDLPEDLSTLDDTALDALLLQLESEFDQELDAEHRDLPVLTQLANQIETIRNEVAARELTAAEEDAAIAALADRVHGQPEATDVPIDPEDPPEDEVPEAPAPEDAAEERELVTASAARRPLPSARSIGRKAGRPSVRPAGAELVITASADVPGLPMGARIDTTRVAQAFHDRARGLNDGSPRVPVCRVQIPGQVELSDNPERNVGLLDELLQGFNVGPTAASLVASGGWCVPSTPLLDMFSIGDADGLIDLPSVTVRGGMLVPSFYSWTDPAAALWTWTEANDIAAVAGTPTKPCMKIPCPTWTDIRLEAEGLCLTHGNLSDRAYPALTRRFVDLAMIAHLHRLSAAKTAKIVANATAVAYTAENSDAVGDLLSAIELTAADMRSQYRASDSRAVEVLLPSWTKPMARANMAKRAGVDFMNVTDGQVTGWLTSRGVRPQFLSDYQPLFNTTPAVAWPAALEFTAYFSGAYVEGNGGSIDLGVVRDSTLNETNDFTAAWSEQFYSVMRLGPVARKVTVDIAPVDGVTACCPAA